MHLSVVPASSPKEKALSPSSTSWSLRSKLFNATADQSPGFSLALRSCPLTRAADLAWTCPKSVIRYWPHRVNYERLHALDWRLLCPGPMANQPAIGLERLRISIEGLPTPLPAITRSSPAALALPLFAMKIPEMIVPYADAASVILANVQREVPNVEEEDRNRPARRHEREE